MFTTLKRTVAQEHINTCRVNYITRSVKSIHKLCSADPSSAQRSGVSWRFYVTEILLSAIALAIFLGWRLQKKQHRYRLSLRSTRVPVVEGEDNADMTAGNECNATIAL